jgi:hypothetical protein
MSHFLAKLKGGGPFPWLSPIEVRFFTVFWAIKFEFIK